MAERVRVTTIKVDPPTTPRPKPDTAWTRSRAYARDTNLCSKPGGHGTEGSVRLPISQWVAEEEGDEWC